MWCPGDGEKQTDTRTIKKVELWKTGVLFDMGSQGKGDAKCDS